jgi:acetyl-CoA acetyltransferase
MGLEEYGLCGEGEGGKFVEGGTLGPGGRLPTNTSGGSLSEAYVHGFNLETEAVRQIRGTSTSQVPGCKNVLVTGAAAVSTSAVVLRGD